MISRNTSLTSGLADSFAVSCDHLDSDRLIEPIFKQSRHPRGRSHISRVGNRIETQLAISPKYNRAIHALIPKLVVGA